MGKVLGTFSEVNLGKVPGVLTTCEAVAFLFLSFPLSSTLCFHFVFVHLLSVFCPNKTKK